MLLIRGEQLQVLGVGRLDALIDRIAADLPAACPAACAGLQADALRELARRELQRAWSYGLRRERDLFRFVTLMLVIGAGHGSDEPAQVREYMTDARVPDIGQRLSRLHAASIRQLEIEARNQQILGRLGLA